MIKKTSIFLQRHSVTIVWITGSLIAVWLERAPLINFMIWISDRKAVIEFIRGYGAWGPLLYILLLLLQILIAVIPGQALVIAGGYVFGFFPALLITLPSAIVGSQIAFYLTRRHGRPIAYRLASQKVIDRWENISRQQGIVFYFLTFVLPIFPSDAMCYVAGLGTISSKRFLVANTLGRLTSTIFTVLVGAYGLRLPPLIWVTVGLLAGGFYICWLYYARKHQLTQMASKA